jgi:phosphohistidine phosphatase SixA
MSKYIVLMSAGDTFGNDLLSDDETGQVKSTTKKMIAAEIKPDFILTSFAQKATGSGNLIVEEFRQKEWAVPVRASSYLDRGDIIYQLDTLDKLNTGINTVVMVSFLNPICSVSEELTGKKHALHPAQAMVIQCDEKSKEAGGGEYTWGEIAHYKWHEKMKQHRCITTFSPE